MYCLKNNWFDECYIAYERADLEEIILSLYEEASYEWYLEIIQNKESYSTWIGREVKMAYSGGYDETLDWNIYEATLII